MSKTLERESGLKALSVFDLDHTLFKCNSSFEFGRYLYQRKLFSTPNMLFLIFCYFRHKICGLSLDALHHKVFERLFFGQPVSFFTEQIPEFLDNHFSKMTHTSVFERLQLAKRAGHYTAILSNSPHFLVAPIAKRFQVDFFEGSIYQIKNNVFQGISSLLKGKEKAQYLKELSSSLGIHAEQITVYTDSFLDFPLAVQAGRVVAVNPDRKLRKECLKNSWEILK